MTFFVNRLKMGALACALSFGLGGCLDLDEKITFNPDSSLNVDVDLRFDDDFKDISHFFEVMGRAGPEAAKFQNGICGALQKYAEQTPQPNVTLTSRQVEAEGKFVCQVRVVFTGVDAFLAKATEGLPPDSPLQIKTIGERRVLIALDLGAVPDYTSVAEAAVAKGVRDVVGAELPTDPSQPIVSDAEIWQAYQAAMVASVRISFRDRHVTLTFQAPQIVESVGHFSQNGNETQFRFSWVEVMELALYPEKRRGKILSVVVQY